MADSPGWWQELLAGLGLLLGGIKTGQVVARRRHVHAQESTPADSSPEGVSAEDLARVESEVAAVKARAESNTAAIAKLDGRLQTHEAVQAERHANVESKLTEIRASQQRLEEKIDRAIERRGERRLDS